MVINESNSIVWLDMNNCISQDVSEVVSRSLPECLIEIHVEGYIKECGLETHIRTR